MMTSGFIQIERDGRTYTGWREVTADRGRLRQTIHYQGRHKADRCHWPGDQRHIQVWGEWLLRELVNEAKCLDAGR